MEELQLDFARLERIGLEEAVYGAGKSPAQLTAILEAASARNARLLLTRLDAAKVDALPDGHRRALDYCPESRTAFFGIPRVVGGPRVVALVAAGTSDMPVVREAERTLRYHGRASTIIADVGVAGLWRLTSRLEELRRHTVVIVVAGMDAALPSVVGGLVSAVVLAVPTSVGYGVAQGGHAALHAALASCAPGVAVMNIDNGYGAACAALRVLHAAQRLADGPADGADRPGAKSAGSE
ncbi:MAG TPA: nickel pincer cofactor biosynthesis protein LarB [Gemmatirosa sp.]